MRASLNSKYYRPGGHFVEFDIDELANKEIGTRELVEVVFLSGDKIWVDWGYKNAGAKLEIGNIKLSREDYDMLVNMKKDNDYTEYLFHYLDTTWPVFITDLQKTSVTQTDVYSGLQLLITGDPIETEV